MAFNVTWGSSFEAQPAGSDNPTQGDDRIRELKTAIRQRLDQEHVFGTSDGANQGVHAQGSALVYYQDAEPSQLPDEETSLGDNTRSKGRLWIDTNDSNRFYHYTGASWSSAWAMGSLTLSGAAAVGTSLSVGTTLSVTGVATFTAQPVLSSLTASLPVFTDGSKGLVSNAMTGTGNVVMSASPTLTGTVTMAAVDINGGAIDGTAIGGGTPSTGAFTTISSSGLATLDSVNIDGGNIDGTTIGGSTAAAGSFTTLSASTSITGTLATAAQTNITSVGTLSSLTVSGDVNMGTNVLFVDQSADRVGINDTTPSCTLDVDGAVRMVGGHRLVLVSSWTSSTTEGTVYDEIAAGLEDTTDGIKYMVSGVLGTERLLYLSCQTNSFILNLTSGSRNIVQGSSDTMESIGGIYV